MFRNIPISKYFCDFRHTSIEFLSIGVREKTPEAPICRTNIIAVMFMAHSEQIFELGYNPAFPAVRGRSFSASMFIHVEGPLIVAFFKIETCAFLNVKRYNKDDRI